MAEHLNWPNPYQHAFFEKFLIFKIHSLYVSLMDKENGIVYDFMLLNIYFKDLVVKNPLAHKKVSLPLFKV